MMLRPAIDHPFVSKELQHEAYPHPEVLDFGLVAFSRKIRDRMIVNDYAFECSEMLDDPAFKTRDEAYRERPWIREEHDSLRPPWFIDIMADESGNTFTSLPRIDHRFAVFFSDQHVDAGVEDPVGIDCVSDMITGNHIGPHGR